MMCKRKTTPLNVVRRKLAFRIAETICDYLRSCDEEYDIDDATDLIANLIPDTRAEAEADFQDANSELAAAPRKPSMLAKLREVLRLEPEVSIAKTLDLAVHEITRLEAIVEAKRTREAEAKEGTAT